ncbi:MAG: hypothetical protein VB013_10955 [Anaerolineaceae bacterium]|nr:hypothetical protein [Anaerolineaceae bacterium]
MKKIYLWLVIVVLLFLLVVVACSKQATETGQTKSIESTSNAWNHWVSLPQSLFSGDSTEKIAERLFSLYLDQFKDELQDESIQLDDYRIDNIAISEKSAECAKELQVDSIVDLQYSVKPPVSPNPNWVAGSGVVSDSSQWITEKLATIAIYTDGSNYTFKTLGVPFCSGIAIDGNTLH